MSTRDRDRRSDSGRGGPHSRDRAGSHDRARAHDRDRHHGPGHDRGRDRARARDRERGQGGNGDRRHRSSRGAPPRGDRKRALAANYAPPAKSARSARASRSRPRPETSAKRAAQQKNLQKQNRAKRKQSCSDFLTNLVFENKLPGIPFKPKFVVNGVIPGGPAGLSTYYLPELDYQRNSLEESKYQYPLLCEADVGCPLDFIDAARFRIPPKSDAGDHPEIHPDDAALLTDELADAASMRADLLAQHWVQKEMISENMVHSDHHHISQVEREEKALRQAKENEAKLLAKFTDGKPKHVRVEEEFAFANSDDLPQHPTKPHIKPVRSWAMVPHADLNGRKYASLHFDHDFTKATPMPFPEAPEYGYLLQKAQKKKKKKKKKKQSLALEGTFYVPEKPQHTAEAVADDGPVRQMTVGTVKVAVNTNASDPNNPYLLWWDPANSVLRYSSAIASIILSNAPETTDSEPGTVERVSIVHPGDGR